MYFKLPVFAVCLFFLSCQDSKSPKASTAAATGNDSVSGGMFSDHIRTTGFQTPEQERKGFKLPPGFEISLYASEPDISKPINMEFDAAGRLWVTQSSEYPMAAAPGSGHDRITVISDTNGDGKADKFTHFADDLNIPIAITPVIGGAIGYSIPNVYRFYDRDGDGRYDDKKILLGPFGHQDTHGMVSNLIRGYDGWIHACHGFTNTSTVAGTDGDSVTMISGNTFRFKEDGTRVEQTTYGRVNPFGFAFDEWGYLYSVDCHSKPIYQLIKGAEYPHFGKKSPSIGFAPEMMSYELGSTALSGLVYYIGNGFPADYQNSFYNGDVVTCRINRNTIGLNGSSPISKRQEDFLISSDPWFRPVNIKLGPDGSMYVADFYNRIIGHYEVPLNHAGRDRQSGRIWKITYTGKNKTGRPQNNTDWSQASIKELIGNLNHPQLNIRMMIADQLVDRFGQKALTPVLNAITSGTLDSKAYIQSLWVLHRLNALKDAVLEKALNNADPMVQTHALRILSEKKSVSSKQRELALIALDNTNANVKRMAAAVAASFPDAGNVKVLIAQYGAVSETDSHLKYAILLSLRQNLRNAKVMHAVATAKWNEHQLATLINVMPDVPSQEAASYTLDYIQAHKLPEAQMTTSLEFIGRYVASNRLDPAIAIIQKQFADKINIQYQIYQTIRKGMAQKGVQVGSKMRNWGILLARTFLNNIEGKDGGWWNINNEKGWVILNPWNRVTRSVVPGAPPVNLLWSQYDWDPTGKLHSPLFRLPAKLSIDVFDSDLVTQEPNTGVSRNVLRIRLDKSQQVIGEYRARSKAKMAEKDVIRPVTFDLSSYKDQLGYIEVVDSTRSAGGIGIGNILPPVVSLPAKGPGEISALQIKAAEIAGDLKVAALEPQVLQILTNPKADIEARAAAATALMNMAPGRNAKIVSDIFVQIGASPELRQKLVAALEQMPSPIVLATLQKGLVGAPRFLQLAIAGVLVKSPGGIVHLINSAKAGDVDAELIDDVSVKERLFANSTAQQKKQIDQFMQAQSGREDRRQIIAERLKSFDSSKVTVTAGKQVFVQNCSMCHQIKGNGGMIGPQLDGIGNWGQKALTEKILNPNGNISEAFRNYNITLKNGKALSGLYRREEGEVLIFANPNGQEFPVAKIDIKDKVASKYTLMPDQFSKTIPKAEFDALLKFLLNTKE